MPRFWSIDPVMLGLALFVVPAVALLAWCHYGENPISRYDTYADAVADGAITRGWIPNYLPQSIHTIVEQHNIDTNHVSIRFKYRIGDLGTLSETCDEAPSSDAGAKLFRCVDESGTLVVQLNSDGSGYASTAEDDT